jgi:hypothetical protein
MKRFKVELGFVNRFYLPAWRSIPAVHIKRDSDSRNAARKRRESNGIPKTTVGCPFHLSQRALMIRQLDGIKWTKGVKECHRVLTRDSSVDLTEFGGSVVDYGILLTSSDKSLDT